MRWCFVLAGSVIVAMSSSAVMADDKHDCLKGINHDLRIKGCSAVIDRNPNDAGAYYTRGVAYQFKGNFDRAISDYNEAIDLNPYHVSAYDKRGRAYASRGDYTNAVADVTKASELVATSAHHPKKVSTEVGLAKASELAPTSTSPQKEIAAEGALKKARPVPKEVKKAKKEDRPLKNTGPAKEAKMTATSAPVAKKASSQPFGGSKPAWAPQAWESYGESAN